MQPIIPQQSAITLLEQQIEQELRRRYAQQLADPNLAGEYERRIDDEVVRLTAEHLSGVIESASVVR